jgi:hypothetical protein
MLPWPPPLGAAHGRSPAFTPRADFLGATYDAVGGFWGGVVEQLGPPDASNTIPTSGYIGRLK